MIDWDSSNVHPAQILILFSDKLKAQLFSIILFVLVSNKYNPNNFYELNSQSTQTGDTQQSKESNYRPMLVWGTILAGVSVELFKKSIKVI